MRRILTVGFVVVTFSIWTAIAQVATTGTQGTTGTPTTTSLAGNSPTVNLRTAGDRNPGRRVQQALARHAETRNARVNAPRSGNTNRNSNSSTDGGTGTTGDASGLGDLLGLLGGLGGLGGTTSGGTTTGGASGLGADINALISLAQSAGIDISGLLGSLGGATAQTRQADDADESLMDQLQKLRNSIANRSNVLDVRNRAQTATTERGFKLRLADRLTSTVFTALNLAVRQRVVIDAIKGGLRPLFPNLQNADNSNANSNSSQNSNTNTNGSTSGGSIDDVPSPADNGNSNSLV